VGPPGEAVNRARIFAGAGKAVGAFSTACPKLTVSSQTEFTYTDEFLIF